MTQDLIPSRTDTAIAVQSTEPIAVVGQMLHALIEKGVTADNVAALEKTLGLLERMDAKKAEREFNAAFVALQNDIPVIVAQTVIPNRGRYERFEDVMRVVQPLLTKHGFSVSFSNENKDNRITETCHLMHVGGHKQANSFTVRVGGKADSETQADCKAGTTAKRNSLLQCLNIVIRQDCLMDEDDGRMGGEFITHEQALELQRRVCETESNELLFLQLAGVRAVSGKPTLDVYKSILSDKYEMLDAKLRIKEQKGR